MPDYLLLDECLYTPEDEWLRVDEASAFVGVSDYAQQELGDIVFLELPEVGSQLVKDESYGVIESVKAVTDLFAPVSGEVLSVNKQLVDNPQLVNEDCYGDGWILEVSITDETEIDSLLDAVSYRNYIAERKE